MTNPVLTVDHVLTVFPTRKKSWAYRELKTMRDALGKRFVTLTDMSGYLDLNLDELRAMLTPLG